MNQPQDDKAHADIGLVCALPMEVQPFLDRCEHLKKYTGGSYVFRGGFLDRIKVAVVQTGVGFARARAANPGIDRRTLSTMGSFHWFLGGTAVRDASGGYRGRDVDL